jgi:DnaJ-class molecular chaperone
MDREAIEGWLTVIDQVSYYELLGVAPGSGQDQIRRAFHGFAVTFHPDTHVVRSPEERAAISRIFTRGTEAYRVLSDSLLRSHYDEQRAGPGQVTRLTGAPPRGPQTAKPPPPPPVLHDGSFAAPATDAESVGRLEDHVRNARARPFAQEAEALAKKHEYVKAKLQLQLAMNMDPGNPVLQEYLSELQIRITEAKRKAR